MNGKTVTTQENVWKHILLRVLVVSGIALFVGYLLYGASVFISTMRAFQFIASGVTAGLAYAFLKGSTKRNMWTALFVWYVILTGLLVNFSWWLSILNCIYVVGVTAAIFAYDYAIHKPFVRNIFLRVVAAGAVIAAVNGCIVFLLSLFSVEKMTAHFTVVLQNMLYNAEIGVVIGLAIGVGIELAEYFDTRLVKYESTADDTGSVTHDTQ